MLLMTKQRNYAQESAAHKTPSYLKENAARKRARYAMEKAGRVVKGDAKQVDHKNFKPLDNSTSNLRVVDKKVNLSKQPKRGKK
jgi:hypothetical protein